MGRKSRLKRERKQAKARIDKLATGAARAGKDQDTAFDQVIQRLREILRRYSPVDAILAVAISDLWLPNIASQVNHQLALAVAISMQPDDYAAHQQLDSYDDFYVLVREIYAALPRLPSLEDYVPEPDWGEVHLDVLGKFIPVLYGGNIERVVDFVAAFRFLRGDDFLANSDMNFALLLQNHLITNIDTQPRDRRFDIAPGHLEIPPEPFWRSCKEALLSASAAVMQKCNNFSQRLILNLGDFKMPRTTAAFGDAVLTGLALPALMARVGTALLPLSPRNAPGLVIDYWSNRNLPSASDRLVRLAGSLSEFISDRFDQRDVITGRLVLSTSDRDLAYVYAAVCHSKNKIYLIVPVATVDTGDIKRMRRKIQSLMSTPSEWWFKNTRNGQLVQLHRTDGVLPAAEDIVIFVIHAHLTTVAQVYPSLGDDATLISLSDFVSIFDSLKDIGEFSDFLAYLDSNGSLIMSPFLGLTDLFGSFRDSFGLLVGGALEPTMISLDPHWGSNWRYKELSNFWASAPRDFPDDKYTWNVEPGKDSGTFRMISKGWPTLAWSTFLADCAVHVVFPFVPSDTDAANGDLLETFVHCAADALSQRADIVATLPLFERPKIVLVCRPNGATTVDGKSRAVKDESVRQPLLSSPRIMKSDGEKRVTCLVAVNLSRVQYRLNHATDASFEAECVQEILRCLSEVTGEALDPIVLERIAATSTRRPRFVVTQYERDVDVPDFAKPVVPQPKDYKIARRDLAVVFQNIGAEPGRYQLSDAKSLIDRARDEYRIEIHKRVGSCDHEALVTLCIQQHDALTTEYIRITARMQASLDHEVSFDRADALAKAHDHFTRSARNYRYLLEVALSSPNAEEGSRASVELVQLAAAADWMFVLSGASDVLHNGIDVGGIELDRDYVPEVFYSEKIEEKEREFSLESANIRLGIELESDDEIHGLTKADETLLKLDKAFQSDLDFTFTHLVQALMTLAKWATASGSEDLRLSYQASVEEITEVLCRSVEVLQEDEARRLIKFLTLNPAEIRLLLGKTLPESDVPVWEHNKRSHRYLIRPLIARDSGGMIWGAGAAERAARIWFGSISDGYLPADFDWRSVKVAVRDIKKEIERALERRAWEICSRATPYLVEGVDFMRRFPKEGFEDVGDFDVLAYWPETNRWLSVECKYNQPPFCLKDARRLRDRIFGVGENREQFAKIERRHAFLQAQYEKLRGLLNWPVPKLGADFSIIEAYVSREIYWWMRNPPYKVDTHFVRIDALNGWLRTQSLLSN